MDRSVVGREPEIDAALRALDGAGVVLCGPAGVGKTALARLLADRLAATGDPVVRLLATESGRSLPFSAFAPLMVGRAPDQDPSTMPQQLITALGAERSDSGAGRPVLVMDDAHLLDERSAAALLAIVVHGGARLIATVRTGVRSADAVTALWRDRGLGRLDLAPLDVEATGRMLTERLGGEVAQVTAWSMWSRTNGNPLYLDELILFGLQTGRLTQIEGVFWWPGAAEVSPRLRELLGRRLDDAGEAAKQALDVLAMGEPMRLSVLTEVSSVDAVGEAEKRGLITVDEGPTGAWVRFAHPMIAEVATSHLSALRRRLLADRLRTVAGEDVDLLRRAAWEEAASDTPDVDLLRTAALSVLVTEPRTTVRLAARAEHGDPGPQSSVTKADALAELGRAEEAMAALDTARSRVRDDADLVLVAISSSSLRLWTMRDAVAADEELRILAGRMTGAHRDQLLGARAMTALFSGRPADAHRLAADAGSSPDRPAALRARLVDYAACLLMDDGDLAQARRAFTELAAQGPLRPSYPSLFAAFETIGTQLAGDGGVVPHSTGPVGRWAAVRTSNSADSDQPGHSAPAAWSLAEGIRQRAAGATESAARTLREAVVEQWSGEGIFRTEATALAAVALVEAGRFDQAVHLWDRYPADGVCSVPGLQTWAAGVLRQITDADAGNALIRQAAAHAAQQQCSTLALSYLMSLLWTGAAGAASEAVMTYELFGGGTRAAAFRAAIAAAAAAEEPVMRMAGEQLTLVGLVGDAGRLLALRSRGIPRPRDDAGTVPPSRRMPHATGPGLTTREAQIAVLASAGLQDREIAEQLVLSVRTVESHLAAAYRKLGITSRRELRGLDLDGRRWTKL